MSNRRTAAGQFALEEQRRRLVTAASDAILERGLSGVTLAHIASAAGISTGSVNFYFSSKEELLLETLKSVTEEYYRAVQGAVEDAGQDPAARLRALVMAATDPAIVKPGHSAVWYAFMSEAKSRREYMEVCASHDDQFYFLTLELCRALMAGVESTAQHDPEVVALAIIGLIELAWQGVLYETEFDQQRARMQCLAFLAAVFPSVFVPAQVGTAGRRFGRPGVEVSVRAASASDLTALAVLVHRYRLASGERSLLPETKDWLAARLEEASVETLLAEAPDGTLQGFCLSTRSHCPLSLAPYRILQALFVDGDLRRGGVGQALLARALAACAERGEIRLEVQTPSGDSVTRALYQSAGARELADIGLQSIPVQAAS